MSFQASHPSAEAVVSPDLAAELLDSQLPFLAPARVEPLALGWDYTTHRVNEELVFRFPRRESAVPLLETENRLLPQLAPRLPLPVPVPSFLGQPSDRFRWPFSGYHFLPGRTAAEVELDDRQRAILAEPLGQFLGALHAIPAEEMIAMGATGDDIGRLDLATRVPRALEVLHRLPEDAIGVETGAVRQVIESSRTIRAPSARVLTHGNLGANHLLVDDAGGLCGVIDWSDLHLGNPAVDLAVACGFLPPDARPTFLRAYGRRIPAAIWWLARFRAIFSALCQVDYGRQTGNAGFVGEGRRCLAHALASS